MKKVFLWVAAAVMVAMSVHAMGENLLINLNPTLETYISRLREC